VNQPAPAPVPLVVEGDGLAWAWTAIEVTAAYDLSRRTDYARLTPVERLEYAVREQAGYLDRLLAVRPGEVAALRFTRAEPGRLRLWLLGRTSAPTPDTAQRRAVQLAAGLLDVPSNVVAEPVPDAAAVQAALTPFIPAHDGLAQIGKRVRIQRPERPDAGVENYLAVEPFAQERVDWTALLRLLAGHPYQLCLTVALTPERVSPQVRRTLESEATRYARLSEAFEGPADVGGRIRFPPDSAAAILGPIYRDALTRYADRAFRFSVTIASPVALDEMVVEALGRTISPAPGQDQARHDPTGVPTGYATARPARPVEYDALRNGFATLQPVELPDLQTHAQLNLDLRPGGPGPVRRGLLELRCLVDRAEALSLFRLPVALDGNVPGFPVHAPRDQIRVVDQVAGRSLLIGRQGDDASTGTEVRLAAADLPRHGFIVGTPGSGKTNTALHLCRQLWADHRIPFLVIEPVNAELDDYRWLATLPGFDDLLVLTVGDESVAPLRLNPFEVPVGTTLVSHVSNLLACFEAAFGLWDPLPFIYRRALTRMYRRRGFHPDDRGTEARQGTWPVLPEFVAALAEVTKELGYSGEVGHNIDAAARLRAEALAEGACGVTLDCRRSFDIGALTTRPVVVELAGVGDNAKEQALVTLLLLNAVRGHRRSGRAALEQPHVMLIEEAHRIFPRATPSHGGDVKEANAQALAAERIAQGLAEDRKYGQSYLLVDQQVGKVAEDAYKITNLKVMHRTAAEEDRLLLGSTMSMHPDQISSAAALAPFEALVSLGGLDRAVSLRVPDVRAEDAARLGQPEAPLADDAQLRTRHALLLTDPRFADAMAPYDECAECRHRCAFRRHAESVVTASPPAAGRVVDLAVKGPWSATVHELGALAGPGPLDDAGAVEDYQVCVFIHAMLSRYPLAKRRPADVPAAVAGTARARKHIRDGLAER
jgi:hypothetical protein